jgi:PAS domain-containing protein
MNAETHSVARPHQHANKSLNTSQLRLESTRAVLARAAAQLCQADAVLRGEQAPPSADTTNVLEYVDRKALRPVAPARTTIERPRPWTRDLSTLRARAVKCGLRGNQPNPLAEVTEDTLATCESMLQELAGGYMECERLREDVRAEAAAWERLFAAMPVACVVADRNGCILEANHAAGTLLNLGAKRLRGRNLLLFSRDRAAFMAIAERAADATDPVEASLVLRPRERKPLPVAILVVPPSPDSPGPWLWFLTAAVAAPADATIDDSAIEGAVPAFEADALAGCARCGDEASDGQHASDADCLEALEHRIRTLHSRIAEVRDRCALLAANQADGQ